MTHLYTSFKFLMSRVSASLAIAFFLLSERSTKSSNSYGLSDFLNLRARRTEDSNSMDGSPSLLEVVRQSL
ncbi:hypothetical protein DFH05DRAFT_1508644 [Lentinula detonsa]|uniref:Uncharacterized protein n=1 Tax=Lentinula detonsa TaxID=2804962 RepID=A0A9W8TTX2_9AGAR|nr:hypothetical protein DFH05DRAFT_1508644 [Lentinula detonsa]